MRHVHRNAKRTPEETARLRADRERYQREKPTPEQLLAAGGHTESVSLGELIALHKVMASLKKESEKQGLTLAASRSVRASTRRPFRGWRPAPTAIPPWTRFTESPSPWARKSSVPCKMPLPGRLANRTCRRACNKKPRGRGASFPTCLSEGQVGKLAP